MRHRIAFCIAAVSAGLALATAAFAAEQTLTLDPAASTIAFELGATLHTAKGSVKLERGSIQFDPDTGAASGAIVADAKSATTSSESRDANMHADVLESARFPTISFHPERLVVARRDATTADVELHGTLDMHGERHPLVIPAKLAADGTRLRIDATFQVPYVDWGMRDYSTFVLRVDRFVTVKVKAVGTL
jgi:polyisoprenoid-binding protein YceI